MPQFQTFGANPLEFDDPTVYHVREVTPNMTDEEKRLIKIWVEHGAPEGGHQTHHFKFNLRLEVSNIATVKTGNLNSCTK